MKFDIVIPTWNNLNYLKLAIESIEKYSEFYHDIYVHVNEGTDGTIAWLKEKSINYSYFPINKGVCEGTNLAASLGNNEYVVYFNDDMVALPDWDRELIDYIKLMTTEKYLLCCTPIEPTGNNPNCIIRNYGLTYDQFSIKDIMKDFEYLQELMPDMISTWSPMLIPRKLWKEVGGFSVEYEPGFGSDPDICKKMYDVGCRNFIGVGRSLIYHFQTKSTSRVIHNDSRTIFYKKYGINQDYFVNDVLRRGIEI